MRYLAWAVGIIGAALCAFAAGFHFAVGLADQPITLILGCLFGVLMGLLGAVVAAREPRNSIGWLMCVASVSTALVTLPTDYGYDALVLQHGALPFGKPVLWFGAWASIPLFGLILPLILGRFPDGRVRPRWRFAEWVAIAGTLSFGSSVALSSTPLPLAPPRLLALLAPYANNPIGVAMPNGVEIEAWMGGLGTIIVAYVLSASALASRFRSATHEEGIKLKWFAYGGALIALSVVYSGVAWFRSGDLLAALIPLQVTVVALPIAIGIAILRYRLFDIDLIINRSIVYLSLTAILAALYTALITFFNRFVIAFSGQKSDAAYIVTAFVVVVAFSPVKDALQRRVDRRLGGARASAALEKFSSEVESVVSVLDVHRVACRLVDQAVLAFDAYGAELHLVAGEGPLYCHGEVNGRGGIEVQLRHDGVQYGRLLVGRRHGGVAYSGHDRDALQRSADTVGEALALAAHFGHAPLTGRNGSHGSASPIRN
ncbi:MAG TPA: hypothetical protein VGV88_11460 [Candidatus Dormibacteraeota bacterium]|nr:hypothetical protein [Candidatus Dormibacteraeota bacterium]